MASLDSTSTRIDLSKNEDGCYALSTVLLGVSIMQGWNYVNTNADRWPMRVLVSVHDFPENICMDIGTTCINTQVLHYYFIENFGNVQVLSTQPFLLNMELLLTVIIVFMWNRIIPALIVFFTVASFVSIIDLTVSPDIVLFGTERKKLEATLLSATSAIADIIITLSLSLRLAKSKTGIRRTDHVLHKLVSYIISRGILVAFAQTLIVILFPIDQTLKSWMPVHLCMNKLYVITMSTLNQRPNLRQSLNAPVTDTMFQTSLRAAHPMRPNVHTNIEIPRPLSAYSPDRTSVSKGSSPKDHVHVAVECPKPSPVESDLTLFTSRLSHEHSATTNTILLYPSSVIN
ncbi:hypothetical protein BDZ89DRAFT_1061186 [Hymenopellis radicata]|nr:hypothetical protein BDZ89DRAFT_1061186 [Hymenopellis radicata]